MVRVAVVQILPVPSKGSDLYPPAAAHRDSTVLEACGQCVLAEEGHDILRPGAGGHIPIPRVPTQQHIPHASAYAPSFPASSLQTDHNIFYRVRYTNHRLHLAVPMMDLCLSQQTFPHIFCQRHA